jgi:RecB family endonuclease NucS
MLEKDIENLIAKYPDEIFPNAGFKLIGQQIRLGKCYADIIFEDKHKRKIIVEVKRGILSRDASGQVMEYYGLLKIESPDEFIELVLCANIIPPERKKFLETIGIECKELGINFINKLAEKYHYDFINAPKRQNWRLTLICLHPIKYGFFKLIQINMIY